MTDQRHAQLGIHPLDAAPAGAAARDPTGRLKRRQVLRRTRLVAIVVLLLLAAGATRTVLSRIGAAQALEDGTAQRDAVYVKTTRPQPAGAAGSAASLNLPGTLQGSAQGVVAARTSGYLRRWTHDIGSRVRKGELLAEIDTPEVDQQLAQAAAARDQAAASLELARSTAERWEGLRRKDVVSQQELDERRSAVIQVRANLAAAEANVQRLRQTESFKRVTAPFAGVITRRNVEAGDLVDVGAARPLFLLAQTDPLRVVVNVPQALAQAVKPGMAVVVTQAELRGQRFAGSVARTAGAIDTATRTLPVEVSVPNAEGTLIPGAYVQVALPLGKAAGLTVPNHALLFRAEGVRVAQVDAAGKVTLKPVTLGRNFGETVEVSAGVGADDRLVLNPPDSLADGDRVRLAAEAPARPAAAASQASGARP